jgi:hypothetical protein
MSERTQSAAVQIHVLSPDVDNIRSNSWYKDDVRTIFATLGFGMDHDSPELTVSGRDDELAGFARKLRVFASQIDATVDCAEAAVCCPVCGEALPEGDAGWGSCPQASNHDSLTAATEPAEVLS